MIIRGDVPSELYEAEQEAKREPGQTTPDADPAREVRPLFVPLESAPFWRFKKGTKTVEVRQAGARWNERTVWSGRPVLLRRGYSTKDEITGTVGRVAYARNWQWLPDWAKDGAAMPYITSTGCPPSPAESTYFDPNRGLLAFEVL